MRTPRFAFGGTSDKKAPAIATDRMGGVVVIGEFAGTMRVGTTTLTSAGGKDVFVVFLDSSLAPVSALRYGGVADERATVVSVDSIGNIVFGGIAYGDVDFGGGVLTGGGGGAFQGSIDLGCGKLTSQDSFDTWLAKLNP